MQIFYIVSISLLVIFGQFSIYMRLKKITDRKFTAEYSLYKLHYSPGWTKIILIAFLLWVQFTSGNLFYFFAVATMYILSEFTEWSFRKRNKYCAFLIDHNTLIENNYKVKKLNLEELTMIDFSPWIDAYKLKFKDGQYVLIHRPTFDKNAVNEFVKRAIQKSNFSIVIVDDAKSKIYSS